MNAFAASQEGQIEPDNSVGRFLADTMASVPRISSDAFDKLFNDSVQVGFPFQVFEIERS